MSCRVSVVVPVYNMECFLQQGLASLQAQTLDGIEFICVDDGSTDRSWEMLTELASADARIVSVQHSENRGLHVARKTGVMHASGDYVMFMDPDDEVTLGTCESVYGEIVARGLDILRFGVEPVYETCGARAEQVKRSLEKRFGELWGHRAILQAFFGELDSACYLWDKIYRRDVCVRGFSLTEDCHLPVVQDRYECLAIFSSAETYGERDRVCYRYNTESGDTAKRGELDDAAALVAFRRHCLRGRTLTAMRRLAEILQAREQEISYQELLIVERERLMGQVHFHANALLPLRRDDAFNLQVLSFIRESWEGEDGDLLVARMVATGRLTQHRLDRIISSFSYRLVSVPCRVGKFFSRLKDIARKEGVWRALETVLFVDARDAPPELDWKTVFVESIKVHHGRHRVEGIIRNGMGDGLLRSLRVFRVDRDEGFTVSLRPGRYRFYRMPGATSDILNVYFFRFDLEDLPEAGDYGFCLLDGERSLRLEVDFGPNAPLSSRYPHTYCRFGKMVLSRRGSSIVRLRRWSLLGGLVREMQFCGDLLRKRTLPETLAVFVRLSFPLVRRLLPRRVWLLSDKLYNPDDNGLAFFKHLRKNESNVQAYFLLSTDSLKRQEVSKIGKVVTFGSIRHFYLILIAEAVISSESYSYNKPPMFMLPYSDRMWKSLRVFLTHGVLDSDNSNVYGRAREAFDLIVASREKEVKTLIADPWGYDRVTIVLSGLARYDYLQAGEIHTVTLMFKWRPYLTAGRKSKDKNWDYDARFLASRYYSALVELSSDQRIQDAARAKGLSIQLVLHPCLWAAHSQFASLKGLTVLTDEKSFSQIISESALLVTDYSSLYHDFLYLRKPVLFYQFDRSEFAEKMGLEAGFSPNSEDAPGPVCSQLENVVAEIVRTIDRNFESDSKYTERIETWFPRRDSLNCQRIFSAIQGRLSFD